MQLEEERAEMMGVVESDVLANLPALRNDTVIARLEAARSALAEADSIQQTKLIADVAGAAKVYARRRELGKEAIALAQSVEIEAFRKLGEQLKETARNVGTRGQLSGGTILVPPEKTLTQDEFPGGTKSVPPGKPPTLQVLGLNKKTSAIAQRLADLPQKAFEEVRTGLKTIAKALAKPRAEKPQTIEHEAPTPERVKELEARIVELEAELEKATDDLDNLSFTAREMEIRLTAFEAAELDEQQKEIIDLQKKIDKLEFEIKRLTRQRNDYQETNNQLKREVGSLRRRLGRA